MSRIFFLIFFIISCNTSNEVYQAQGVFVNSDNLRIGTVDVMEQGDGSQFRIHLDTLKPGTYAMHIHEKGECKFPDFLSSGGHHGLKDDGSFYGDFNPIYVKNELSQYTGKLKKFNQTIYLEKVLLNPKSEFTILDDDGSAIIVHATPQGGKRIACAVINRKY